MALLDDDGNSDEYNSERRTSSRALEISSSWSSCVSSGEVKANGTESPRWGDAEIGVVDSSLEGFRSSSSSGEVGEV